MLTWEEVVAAARILMLNACAVLAISSVTSGCSSTGTVTRPTAPELVASEKALALPPPGGPAIVGVIERPRGNGVEQNITLATTTRVPGENYIRIEFYGPDIGSGPTHAFRTISESGIRREAAAAIPGVRLTRRMTYLQNSYGPFSYSAGRSTFGDTCLYAWQQIRARTTSSGIGRGFGMIQVRWRLCDTHASEDQLLGAVYGYTIVGTFSGSQWNPFGEPNSADPRIGLTAHPIYPLAGSSKGTVSMGYAGGIDLSPRPPVEQSAKSSTVQSAQVPKAAKRNATGPRVPSPDETGRQPERAPSAEATQSGDAVPIVTVPTPEGILLPNPD